MQIKRIDCLCCAVAVTLALLCSSVHAAHSEAASAGTGETGIEMKQAVNFNNSACDEAFMSFNNAVMQKHPEIATENQERLTSPVEKIIYALSSVVEAFNDFMAY